MQLVQSFISIAEAAAKQEVRQLNTTAPLKTQPQLQPAVELSKIDHFYLLGRRVGER